MSGVSAQLRPLVERVAGDSDLVVEDLEVRRLGRRSLIKVVVDGESGVDSDLSAKVARDLRDAIEADPGLAQLDFVLEVSSRGVDRPLTELRHWRRNRGRLVDFVLTDGALTGRLAAVDDTGIELDTGGAETHRIEYDRVVRAVVVVEFSGSIQDPVVVDPPGKGDS